jgi:hypothetical protein
MNTGKTGKVVKITPIKVPDTKRIPASNWPTRKREPVKQPVKQPQKVGG